MSTRDTRHHSSSPRRFHSPRHKNKNSTGYRYNGFNPVTSSNFGHDYPQVEGYGSGVSTYGGGVGGYGSLARWGEYSESGGALNFSDNPKYRELGNFLGASGPTLGGAGFNGRTIMSPRKKKYLYYRYD